jgi:hypothetical protein
MHKIILLLGVSCCSASAAYSFHQTITMNHNQVPSDQVNFPVLLRGTFFYLKSQANGGQVTNAAGYDIIVASDAGCTAKLDHELEPGSYNAATGAIVIWFRQPALSRSADMFAYLCYGNAAISTSQENVHGVWDAFFELVHHYPNGSTLTANDSTANGNNAAALNGTSAAAGQIAGAASFNGTSNFLTVPNSASLNNWSAQTISVWFKAQTDMIQYARLIEKGSSNEWALVFNYEGSGSNKLSVQQPGSGGELLASTTALADNTWHKVDLTLTAQNGGGATLYIDGVFNVSAAYGSNLTSATHDITIGLYGGGGPYYYHGLLEELQISGVARSADWIAIAFANQKPGSTFLTVGGGAVSSPVFNNPTVIL